MRVRDRKYSINQVRIQKMLHPTGSSGCYLISSLGMSSFSKPFTENSLSRSLGHWHRFHRRSVSVSARLNDTDTECRWNRCQCNQCSSGLTDDRKVTVLQYLHWNCSSLIQLEDRTKGNNFKEWVFFIHYYSYI
jgi:hypothetical protein